MSLAHRTLLVLSLIASLMISGPTRAAVVSFGFTATASAPGFGRQAGDMISGSLTFDSSIAGTTGIDGTQYFGTVQDFVLDGHRLNNTPTLDRIVVDTYATNGVADLFRATVGCSSPTCNATLDFTIEAFGDTGALASANLPVIPPNLSAFLINPSFALADVQYTDSGPANDQLDATLSAVFLAPPTPVPEPSTLVTFLTAGLVLAAVRRARG